LQNEVASSDIDEKEHAQREADLAQVGVVDQATAAAAAPAATAGGGAEGTGSLSGDEGEEAKGIKPEDQVPRTRVASQAQFGAEEAAAVAAVAKESSAAAGEEQSEESWATKADDAAVAPATSDAEREVISGWMKKAGENNKKMKNRFFVIDGSNFSYYSDEKSYDAMHSPIKNNVVPIPQYTIQTVDDNDKRIQLVPIAPGTAQFGARVWNFDAFDQSARDYWQTAFLKAGAAAPTMSA
jgi:hypothetical protein